MPRTSFFPGCRALTWHSRESKVGCPREAMTCQRLTSAVGLTAQSRSSWSCIVLWRIHGFFDNSLRTPSVIALEEQGRLRIMKPDAYDTLVAQYGNPD